MPGYSNDKQDENLQNGDEKIIENIFRYYYKGLCAYAFTLLKNHDTSEEIVQGFFIDLWETKAFLKVNISLKLYLFRSIHNRCINYLKNTAVSKQRFEKYSKYTQDEIELSNIDAESEIYERFFNDNFEIEIHKAINNLAPQQKQIFLLSRFQQKSYADIANELNITVNSVKTQMSRALRKLRSTLIAKLGKNQLFILMLL